MNQSRFIELLNLYVDRQLTPADAAELEAEIMRTPARRQTYRQYCRMQKACTLMFEQERSGAPASAALQQALAEADRKVIAFPNRGTAAPRRFNVYAGFAGAAAMAACVALVLVNVRHDPADDDASPEPVQVAVTNAPTTTMLGGAPIARITPISTVGSFSGSSDFHPVVGLKTFALARELADSEPTTQVAVDRTNLEWMEQVELSPLRRVRAEELTFGAPLKLRTDNRIYEGRYPVKTEMISIQFQH